MEGGVGLEEIVTSYCFRRAAINTADGMASDTKHDQMARRDPGRGVFNGLYLNERFDFNSQAAYLEEDVSEDGLTLAFAHMSLRCHPGAPSGVPSDLLRPLLAADPGNIWWIGP
ncbi:hypothetical protein LHYA1_G001347 [Lachnellula hyalina]|uniref:Uncharacterized protein n=1 Tax=Lachnellula hyalina TaxID=1316788 RepID=A0A8H8U2I9_9HELO|nr:uncharacterized protein LHYA1_G001347 [Lachnellula hyalina]TVY29336.1 hypothetical protein LHYA1_G001347 [Lachnellula hyalina]